MWMVQLHDFSPPPPPLLSLTPGGRLLFRFFLDPNSLTRENTFSLLGFSLVPLLLLGLPVPRHAFAFSRSRACRFWRIRELAIAAARDMFPPGGARRDCAPRSDEGREGGSRARLRGCAGCAGTGVYTTHGSGRITHRPAAVSRISVVLNSVHHPPSVRPGASWKSFNKSNKCASHHITSPPRGLSGKRLSGLVPPPSLR